METSEEIAELATALAKAQGSISAAMKDSYNPHFKSKYADLGDVWEVARKPLSDNGIAVIQSPENCDSGNVLVKTMVIHTSGQWITSELEMPVDKNTAQGYGSAISYGRRYLLASLIGIYTDDDDDGASDGNEKKVDSNYSTPMAAEKNLEAMKTLDDLQSLCGNLQQDYKAGKTGWTKRSWNSVCQTMANSKEKLEEEKPTKDEQQETTKDSTTIPKSAAVDWVASLISLTEDEKYESAVNSLLESKDIITADLSTVDDEFAEKLCGMIEKTEGFMNAESEDFSEHF